MEVIKPSFEIMTPLSERDVLAMYRHIEAAGRTCYKSEDKNPDNDAEITRLFVAKLAGKGHLSVLEHVSISVRIICDRAIANELVRHRIASYSQESTRYCNYFGKDIQCIEPHWVNLDDMDFPIFIGKEYTVDEYRLWERAMENCEIYYNSLVSRGMSPQDARSVLPLALKTEIVATMNLRAWKEMFPKRTKKGVHPDMLRIMIPLQEKFKQAMPEIFGESTCHL